MQRTWEAWYGILATVGEAETTRGLGAGKKEAKAVQQEAQVGRDQVNRRGAPEIGMSVAHPGQVVLERRHIPLPEVSEPYIRARRDKTYKESEQVSVPEDDSLPVLFYQLGSSSNKDAEGA